MHSLSMLITIVATYLRIPLLVIPLKQSQLTNSGFRLENPQ